MRIRLNWGWVLGGRFFGKIKKDGNKKMDKGGQKKGLEDNL